MMPFAATWMDLKMIIPSKSKREGQISYNTYMWILKYTTSEPVYKTNKTHRHRDQASLTFLRDVFGHVSAFVGD